MKKAMQAVKQFLVEENGPTAVEYAVLLGLIIIGCVVTVASLGSNVLDIFTNADAQVAAVPDPQ